ncbi:aromatic amino acid DMT transporter YddG [Hafnia psychrotolerans]|uniref:Threonine/homoserine exporter RhtA n=1 Tax=Hafnia psychrotolerans TaxID=1477018 RepID=A0ABQ1GLQ8_9GAMM|nr:aromatic amino acid DMT transporter YddG [Hafnia psychrotolerans]GGA46342.1 aromatic amino acid exporter [Hafnia psychrotolerans]
MDRFATLLGVIAILLWSMSVALTRSLAESLGPFGAAASIYTVSGIMVWMASGRPTLRGQSPAYLLICGSLFVFYMVAFSLAIGLAHSRQQTLELGLINYLWPCLTLMFAVPLLRLKVRWWILPGAVLAFAGVMWAISGGHGVDVHQLMRNVHSNPVAYGLAFGAAVAWALYSNLVRIFSKGKGVLPLFLLATGAVLWALYFTYSSTRINLTWPAITELLAMGAVTAISYQCWDMAMKKGNATLVTALSYFTPLSAIFIAGLWLNTLPGASFWPGVGMVVVGSLLCWTASRSQ